MNRNIYSRNTLLGKSSDRKATARMLEASLPLLFGEENRETSGTSEKTGKREFQEQTS
jgi:hypothetical protein